MILPTHGINPTEELNIQKKTQNDQENKGLDKE